MNITLTSNEQTFIAQLQIFDSMADYETCIAEDMFEDMAARVGYERTEDQADGYTQMETQLILLMRCA